MTTNDFVYVLTKAGQEVRVALDGTFEYVVVTNDNDELVLKVDVDTVNYEMMSSLFDPGTANTIKAFIGF